MVRYSTLSDIDQKPDTEVGITKMLEEFREDGEPPGRQDELHKLFSGNVNISRTSFSADHPPTFKPMQISLTNEATMVCLSLRNYSPEQRAFLTCVVALLVTAGIFYVNLTAAWTFTLLLVPMEGTAMFFLNIYLLFVIRFTLKH